jgi:transcriptional antiterminator NusG
MIEDLREKTDEAEEARPQTDTGEVEKPAEPRDAEAAPEQATPFMEPPSDVEASSETERSPDVEAPEREESPDVETSEEPERPDVEPPSEPEESPGVEPEREEEESPDMEPASETETAVAGETEAVVEAETPPDGQPEVEEPSASVEAEAAAEEEAPEAVAPVEETVAPDGDPFSGPGDWYVIHTYAGYENKVKANLGSRIQTMQMQDKIFDVVVPMEDVMEIKGGRKQVVQKKVFPGYLLVKMLYDNDSWYVVRNTPGVTGFVASGTGQKPTPLPRREVEKFLTAKSEETKPAFRLEFEEGDVVRIISGPFTEFTGTIAEINVDQSKLKVMVNIFDRETPVELGFDQVAKV